MPSALETAIASFRGEVLAVDEQAIRQLLAAYQPARARLMIRIEALAADIIEQGVMTGSDALRLQRAGILLASVTEESQRLATIAESTVKGAQAVTPRLAAEHALALSIISAPALADDIARAFVRTNTGAVQALVGYLSDGSPMNAWLNQWGEETGDAIARELKAAVATGTNADQIGKRLAKQLDLSQVRMISMSRTTILDTYRTATLKTYQANSDILDGWIWVSAHQPRTCLACLALDGSFHSLDETFQPCHVRCRCSSVPHIKGEPRGAIETGADWFARQPQSVRDSMVPATAREAMRAGTITLDDWVHLDRDQRWGDRYTQATVENARRYAEKRTAVDEAA